jgi:rhamnosyltransferase
LAQWHNYLLNSFELLPMPAPVLQERATSTTAVVVTFHPDAERLIECLQAILSQVDEVVVVDNGSLSAVLDFVGDLGRVTVLRSAKNQGIAHAQNRGIEWARGRRSAFVLLLDQDSVPASDMVDRLRSAYERLEAGGSRVGAVGPAQVEGFGASRPRFTRFRWGSYSQVTTPPEASSLVCDVLIASGTLIPIAVLDRVGSMNEGLFIDKVDTEWCLRVCRAGLSIYGVPGAQLSHRLGESVLSISWWRGKRLPVHKPFRYYYMVRNSLLLQRMPNMRWAWRSADFVQMLKIIVFHGLLAPGAPQNRQMILRGLRDGLASISGPMPNS